MKKWILSFLAIAAIPAWAYIPPYSMIISRTAENHGRGVFVVEQDVIYHSENDNQVIRETWTVQDENHMKVSFQGLGPLKDVIRGAFVYESRSRVANEGGLKTRRLGEDWVEPFFYFRYSKNIRPRIVQLKMAPPESLRERPPMKSDGPPDYQPESFVQLDRQNGMVAWAISKSFDSPDDPELWIEQDQFVITKLRLPTKSIIEANDYAKFDGGIYLPRQRTYQWNGKTVTVQLRSVRSLGTVRGKDLFTVKQLAGLQFSGSDVLKDFFLRFR